MRQIVLDTETTGLEPSLGHRIVELAAVEIRNRKLTGARFHRYLNPERDSDPAALQVHGLTRDFLAEKPKFAQVAAEFLEFVRGAELVIHNAAFDVAFLNAELERIRSEGIEQTCSSVLDTLRLAKDLHPGKRNSLDALCERYGVDNSQRTLHGALLDAELLAEVYLAMTRGQESLVIEVMRSEQPSDIQVARSSVRELVIIVASQEELELHHTHLQNIQTVSKGKCLWLHE